MILDLLLIFSFLIAVIVLIQNHLGMKPIITLCGYL